MKRVTVCALLCVLSAPASLAQQAPANIAPVTTDPPRQELVNFTIAGRVVDIEDGDSITIEGVRNRFNIRFSDLDTPELAHDPFTPANPTCNPLPYRPGQPGGRAARASLLQMVALNDVVRAECYEIDPYNRPVCHVFKGALNLNLEQIRRGWGWLPTRPEWVRDPESASAEAGAKTSRIGAWPLPNQVHPDVWRRQCWGESKECPNAEPKDP
jgi:micrococcal nuclease